VVIPQARRAPAGRAFLLFAGALRCFSPFSAVAAAFSLEAGAPGAIILAFCRARLRGRFQRGKDDKIRAFSHPAGSPRGAASRFFGLLDLERGA